MHNTDYDKTKFDQDAYGNLIPKHQTRRCNRCGCKVAVTTDKVTGRIKPIRCDCTRK